MEMVQVYCKKNVLWKGAMMFGQLHACIDRHLGSGMVLMLFVKAWLTLTMTNIFLKIQKKQLFKTEQVLEEGVMDSNDFLFCKNP